MDANDNNSSSETRENYYPSVQVEHVRGDCTVVRSHLSAYERKFVFRADLAQDGGGNALSSANYHLL